MINTIYPFNLPRGYIDEEGREHRAGEMRLATARDELEAARDPRARGNQDYASVLVLARVITRLGDLKQVTSEVIEKLFTADFKYLQNMYQTINESEDPVIHVQCPHCGKTFTDTLNFTIGE